MKNIHPFLGASLLAALCLAGPLELRAANPAGHPTNADPPARYNKATGIVGLAVVDPKGERLGEIKDIVFDLKSERVAYAVFSTGAPTEKCLAVPLSALAPSADGAHLVLRAEKAKLATAQGLTAGNWPPATSRIWAAQPGYASAQPAPRVSLPRR